jgi:hypothetical protein
MLNLKLHFILPLPIYTRKNLLGGSNSNSNKELHMFVWSSTASPVSEANLRNAVNHAASTDFAAAPPPAAPVDGATATPKGIELFHKIKDATIAST